MQNTGPSGDRHAGVIPALISCALMVIVLIGLIVMDETWSGPAIAVALVVCLLLMIALGGIRHATESTSAPTPSSLRHVVHRTTGSENRRGDTEAIRAMLRSRQFALDEQDPLIHVQFQVRGLTCAAEAAGLAHKLRERDGVIDATVNPLTERAYIDYTDRLVDAAALTAVITSAGYGVESE